MTDNDIERHRIMEEKVAREYHREKKKWKNRCDRDLANCLNIELAAYRIMKEVKK